MRSDVHRWPLATQPFDVLVCVSDGLQAVGQREIGIAIRLGPESELEASRLTIAKVFATFHMLAARGQVVGAGGITVFGQQAPFAPAVGGIAYTENHARSPWFPEGALVGLLLRPDEAKVAHEAGVYRIIARLGQRDLFFPFPPFFDHNRANVAYADDANSLSVRVGHGRIAGMTLTRSSASDDLVLSAPASAVTECRTFVRSVPPGQGFAIQMDPAQDADGWFVWAPGQSQPAATTPPGSQGNKICLWHILIIPAQPKDEIRMREDGAGVLLTDKSWQLLVQALETGGSFTCRDDASEMKLEWR